MECDICCEPFDHSIRKPCSLSSCPHTYCLKCVEQLNNNKCPHCNELIKGKNINIALLKFIPESNYDQLKATTLKSCIEINEIKNKLKKSSEDKLKSIKQTISDETNKIINILKQNEKILSDECDIILNDINANLSLNIFEIDDSKVKIEKDELNETELAHLGMKIGEIKQNINDNLKKIENKISSNNFLIDELKKVIYKIYSGTYELKVELSQTKPNRISSILSRSTVPNLFEFFKCLKQASI